MVAQRLLVESKKAMIPVWLESSLFCALLGDAGFYGYFSLGGEVVVHGQAVAGGDDQLPGAGYGVYS